jgi:two-component system chemotaxis sensor kinase CheA
LTLSIAAAFIVCIDEQCCAVPQGSVDEILQVAPSTVRSIKGTEVIPYRDGLLPLVRLRKVFSMASDATATLTILVLRSERGAAGLVVDRIRGQREIVVRPLSDPLLRVPGISGATELGDGRPILILDPLAITHGVVRPLLAEETAKAVAHPKQHVP